MKAPSRLAWYLPVFLVLAVPVVSGQRLVLPEGDPKLSEAWYHRVNEFCGALGLAPEGYLKGGVSSVRPLAQALRNAKSPESDKHKLTLIRILQQENEFIDSARKRKARLSETYSTYYADTIAAVAALQDLRGVDALIGAIATGNMATAALARFGEPILDKLLIKSIDSDMYNRYGALSTLQQMAANPELSDSARRRIRKRFIAAASDREAVVRMVAARGLAQFTDNEVHAILERLAREDPAKLPGQAEDGNNLYPVRREALRALGRLPQK